MGFVLAVTVIRRLIVLVMFVVLCAAAASACTCVQISHRKEFHQAHAVFAGRVTSITEDTSYVPPKLNVGPGLQKQIESVKRYLVRFSIEERFKGVRGKTVELYSFQSEGPCDGIWFSENARYLVYAYRKGGHLQDGGLCSRTKNVDRATNEFKELRSFWFRSRSRLLRGR